MIITNQKKTSKQLRDKKYYIKNKTKLTTKNKEYRRKNKEILSKKAKERYQKNRCKIIEKQKAYYSANSEKLKQNAIQRYRKQKEQIIKKYKMRNLNNFCKNCGKKIWKNSTYCRDCFRFFIKPYNKKHLNEKKIISLYGQFSVPEIAKKFNCSNTVIYRILKDNAIKLKSADFFQNGKRRSPDTEFKKGEQHIFFKNWKSFEPYSIDFNHRFKELIKQRDGLHCQLCNIFDENAKKLYKYGLMIHHIDYDKKNSFPQNCISLCVKCHGLTNYNRNHWKTFFQALLKEKYKYEYTLDQKIILDYTRR